MLLVVKCLSKVHSKQSNVSTFPIIQRFQTVILHIDQSICAVASFPVRILCMSIFNCRSNKRGPRQDPCGTPYFPSNLFDFPPCVDIDWHLLCKYDLNHECACPEMPKWVCRRSSRIAWWTVSRAALRSSNTKRVTRC